MSRSFNFCAGPAALPTSVLEKASAEMLDFKGSGMSIMEVTHRGDLFGEVLQSSKARLKALMNIPDTHDVFFMQGGATAQFSLIPSHFLKNKAAYITTGQWSQKAIQTARAFGVAEEVYSSADSRFCHAPEADDIAPLDSFDYLHYTPNETIGGVRFPYVPEVNVPLVADFSSSILSETIDVSKFDFIYAGAQKNIGPAGIVVVIARRSFIDNALPQQTAVFEYSSVRDADSMLNTPPTYSIYLANLVFEWLLDQGGVEAIQRQNARKAELLYSAIDESGFYSNPVERKNRSLMNVPFVLRDSSLDAKFLEEAERARLCNLAGHRSVGGMRASIYNAMPEEGVLALIDFMHEFAKKHG
jgi:phosphoserine aminotransferase